MNRFSPKAILVLPKYFINFLSYAVLELGRYGCKDYTSIDFGNSDITLLREKEGATLCPSVYCVFVIYGITVLEVYAIKFSGLPYFGGISSSSTVFLFYIFLSNTSSSCVICPSSMSSLLLIIIVIASCVTLKVFGVNSRNVVSTGVFALLGW